jgi:hypothetical protein
MSDIHVMFRGRQDDFDFGELFPAERYEALGIADGTDVTSRSVSDTQIRMALAQKYDVGTNEFADHKIETSSNGNITVRANTPFG